MTMQPTVRAASDGIDQAATVIRPPPLKSSDTQTYVLAVLFMTALAVAGIVAVTLARPSSDNTSLILTIVGVVAPTTAALLALLKTNENSAAINDLHLAVNGRLSALIDLTAKSSKAEGVQEMQARIIELQNKVDEIATSRGERP